MPKRIRVIEPFAKTGTFAQKNVLDIVFENHTDSTVQLGKVERYPLKTDRVTSWGNAEVPMDESIQIIIPPTANGRVYVICNVLVDDSPAPYKNCL